MRANRVLCAAALPIVLLSAAFVGPALTQDPTPPGGWNQTLADLAIKSPLSEREIWARILEHAPSVGRGTPNGTLSCSIRNGLGQVVTSITPSVLQTPANWLNFTLGSSRPVNITFTVIPLYDGSPLASIRQQFAPVAPTSITTPFGIPFWASQLTSGPWLLIVESEFGEFGLCPFTVS